VPDILYEDNHVLVVVKPPNMLSQADDTGDTDLLTLLKEDIKERYNKPGNVYLGLVHRLDRPVGGLMAFARTGKAASRLSAQLRTHEMGREYLCVVTGETETLEDTFTLTDYLVMDAIRNRMVVCAADVKGAKLAILEGRVIDRRQGTALCSIRLSTGRKHQIRVQLSSRGTPLWGDNRYGNGIPGQNIALWGYKLTFEHPTTHNKMTFHAMPSGGIWNMYADLLTVPEDTEPPREPTFLHLTPEVIRTLENFDRRRDRVIITREEDEEADAETEETGSPESSGYSETEETEL